MTLQQKIDSIIERHKSLVPQFDDIKNIDWEISGISYKEFDEWRRDYNDKNVTINNEGKYLAQNEICGRMAIFLRSWDLDIKKCSITIYSVPVTFKHTYEAIEEITA